MSIILAKYKVFYAVVPKVACTSLKTVFFKLENGFEFRHFRTSGKNWHIHKFYDVALNGDFPTKRISNFCRITFVRDPVSRFLSAYSNRVLFHKELSSTKKARLYLKQLDLPTEPDIHLFIEKHQDYAKAHTSIYHHTRPMVDFAGDDKDFYHHIFNLSQMAEFEDLIKKLTGKSITVPNMQTGGPKISKEVLSQKELTKIQEIYAADYETYSDFF